MNLAAPHVGYVIAAYAIAFVVIGGMIVATLADYRSLKKALEKIAPRTRGDRDAGA